jgi:hypothetical protein
MKSNEVKFEMRACQRSRRASISTNLFELENKHVLDKIVTQRPILNIQSCAPAAALGCAIDLRPTGYAMRICPIFLTTAALLAGCAQAQAPAPKAIPDTEPDVTAQVSALLMQSRQDTLPREQLTDKAQTALDVATKQQMRAALQPCTTPPTLELLSRTTKGEDRNYLYRALCASTPLLVEINFNKAARVDRLVVRPELKE